MSSFRWSETRPARYRLPCVVRIYYRPLGTPIASMVEVRSFLSGEAHRFVGCEIVPPYELVLDLDDHEVTWPWYADVPRSAAETAVRDMLREAEIDTDALLDGLAVTIGEWTLEILRV